MIEIVCIGASFKRTPVEIRETLVLSAEDLERLSRELLGDAGIIELFYLSTCNRNEFYLALTEPELGRRRFHQFLSHLAGPTLDPARHLDDLAGLPAVHHLMEVAAGLDSMVMGEPQILGQVKDAYERGKQAKTIGSVLDRVLQTSLKSGKRAREETDIGVGAVSVSYAAVELARKIFGNLSHRTAALIGMGEMGTLCAKHLLAGGIQKIFLLNRTFERSQELATELNGIPVPLEEVYPAMAQADIVISSTSAPGYVIQAAPFRLHAVQRKRELLLIDIAIPRDIEPAFGDLPGVFLYDIDDLEVIVDANLRKRQAEAEKVREILREELDLFAQWLQSLEVKPAIIALRERFEQIRRDELTGFRNLPDRERDMLERATRGYMNKLLHTPITNLKDASTAEEQIALTSALNALFQLPAGQNRKDSPSDES